MKLCPNQREADSLEDNKLCCLLLILFDLYGEYRWAGHVARMEEDRSAFKILTGKPTGNIPLGRPRH